MKPKLRLGYHGLNLTLRPEHITTERTARMKTISEKGIEYAISLFSENVSDLKKIMKWNAKQGVKLYRISSNLAPHITNIFLMPKSKIRNWKNLLYEIPEEVQDRLAEIGSIAVRSGIRLTFHPGLHVTLSSTKPGVVNRAKRDIYYHKLLLDFLYRDSKFQPENFPVIILHGGGAGLDKSESSSRWIQEYLSIPKETRKYLVIE
ncbi:MAG TPA: hypothetical protein VGD31_00065, partial [Sphingobacteriaceae bacterium]